MNFTIKMPDTRKCAEFPISIHDMVFTKTYTLSTMLHEIKEPDCGTLMGSIIDVYRSFGWQRDTKRRVATPATKAMIEPPNIHHTRCYHLIAIVADDLERYVRQFDPTFDVFDTMLRICREYHVHHSKTFPSKRHQVGNEEPIALSLTQQKKRKEAEEKEIYCNTAEQEPENETFGRPNPRFNARPPMTDEEKKARIKQRNRDFAIDAKTKKRTHANYMSEKFQRLLPVSILPIFLMYMPEVYHAENQFLIECELLEKNLWTTVPHWMYDTHVAEQIAALGHNRHFVTTLRPSKDLLIQLKENELFFSKIHRRIEKEDDDKYHQSLLALLNK